MNLTGSKRDYIADMVNEFCLSGGVILDTETTGSTEDDEIIDLGIVRAINGDVLYGSLFKPQVPIGFYPTQVSGIREYHVKNAPTFESEWDEISALLKDRWWMAYNLPYDSRMLAHTANRYNLFLPVHFRSSCLMRLYKEYAGLSRTVKLLKACEQMNVKKVGTHRAVSDALATARLAYRMRTNYTPNTKL